MPSRMELYKAVLNGDMDGVKKWLDPDDMEITDWRGWSLLTSACQTGNLRIVRYMKSVGANMNITDKQGKNLLHHAVRSVDLVKFLLDCDLDVNQRDKFGNTPLHNCDPDEPDVVRTLLEFGADVYALSKSNLTPLAKFGRHPISDLLLEYCGDGSILCRRRNCHCETSVFACNYIRFDDFMNHERFIRKMSVTNIPLSPVNDSCTPMFGGLLVEAYLEYFQNSCENEFIRIETEEVGNTGISYFAVWNQEKSALQNPRIQRALTLFNCSYKFPIYGETMRMRLVTGLRKLKLTDPAMDLLIEHVPQLTADCLALIFDHLSVYDLQNIISACRHIPKPREGKRLKRPNDGSGSIAKTRRAI